MSSYESPILDPGIQGSVQPSLSPIDIIANLRWSPKPSMILTTICTSEIGFGCQSFYSSIPGLCTENDPTTRVHLQSVPLWGRMLQDLQHSLWQLPCSTWTSNICYRYLGFGCIIYLYGWVPITISSILVPKEWMVRLWQESPFALCNIGNHFYVEHWTLKHPAEHGILTVAKGRGCGWHSRARSRISAVSDVGSKAMTSIMSLCPNERTTLLDISMIPLDTHSHLQTHCLFLHKRSTQPKPTVELDNSTATRSDLDRHPGSEKQIQMVYLAARDCTLSVRVRLLPWLRMKNKRRRKGWREVITGHGVLCNL